MAKPIAVLSIFFAAALITISWAATTYIVAGIAIAERAERRNKELCPGHRTAQEKWPVVWYFRIAVWPVTAWMEAVPHSLPRVCDRFD